ncbi:MAG: T9SS type A sorting domain-containing protein [Bacteroidetes bacterium]|nr:T9SS type A sorting domain-containing protein [Bacteroidota bacterium]
MTPTLLAIPLCGTGNSNGCPVVISIEELKQDKNMVITYPNPSSGYFTIETSDPEKQFAKLFDQNGRFIFSYEFSSKTRINLTDLQEGVYNLVVKTGDELVNKKLFIIR